jgi:hypothetical protein
MGAGRGKTPQEVEVQPGAQEGDVRPNTTGERLMARSRRWRSHWPAPGSNRRSMARTRSEFDRAPLRFRFPLGPGVIRLTTFRALAERSGAGSEATDLGLARPNTGADRGREIRNGL